MTEAYIIDGVRTPMGRFGGGLSHVHPVDLGAHLPTTVGVDRVIEATGTNIGPVALQQIRELLADLLEL